MKQFSVWVHGRDPVLMGTADTLARFDRFVHWRKGPFQFRRDDGGWGPKREKPETMALGERRIKQLTVADTMVVRNIHDVRIGVRRLHDKVLTLTTEQWIERGALWAINHEDPIHYDPVRPIPIAQVNVHPDYPEGEGPWPIPITTDCSGSVTMLFRSAGAPDPNGLGYNGGGSSLQMTSHLTHFRDIKTARIGDLVTWEGGGHGHVAMILEAGVSDPWLFSHGFEGGPVHIRLSDESGFHSGQTRTFLRRGF